MASFVVWPICVRISNPCRYDSSRCNFDDGCPARKNTDGLVVTAVVVGDEAETENEEEE